MNITLTLGWWILFAFLPPLICAAVATVFYLEKDGDSALFVLMIGSILLACALLTRHL